MPVDISEEQSADDLVGGNHDSRVRRPRIKWNALAESSMNLEALKFYAVLVTSS
jgi:hypothetical protein